MAEHDLQRAFALLPTHISHYQLTLEPNTLFFARPPKGLPDEDGAWDMQEHCQASVSYTHLDVYKRQMLDWLCATAAATWASTPVRFSTSISNEAS